METDDDEDGGLQSKDDMPIKQGTNTKENEGQQSEEEGGMKKEEEIKRSRPRPIEAPEKN